MAQIHTKVFKQTRGHTNTDLEMDLRVDGQTFKLAGNHNGTQIGRCRQEDTRIDR